MCTVSFIPSNKGIVITSNRDEKVGREPASLPQCFDKGNHQLFYPVDGKANGTWFIVRNDGSVGVLLNGAFEKHQPKAHYKESRGGILPKIFKKENPISALQQLNLIGIENFTLLIYYQACLHECKWNGENFFLVQLANRLPHIYSSVTLYNAVMIKQREVWFDDWQANNTSITQQDAIDFHSHTNKENKEFGLQINRKNELQTISITSVCIANQKACLVHKDLLRQQSCEQVISIVPQKSFLPC